MQSLLSLKNRKSIFCFLIIGKLFLLPIIYFLFSYFDSRSNPLFFLGDLSRYEDSENMLNIYNFGAWVSNVGYMGIIFLIKKIVVFDNLRLIFYSLISLIVITYSQAIIINLIFSEKIYCTYRTKIISLIFSLLNFYILIYSFKPSSDVFGCFGIAILINAFIHSKDLNPKKDKYFLSWIFIFLITCLFRNTLFLIVPFILFTKIFKEIKKEFLQQNNFSKFILLTLFTFLLITNFYQVVGQYSSYNNQQVTWGISTINTDVINNFSFTYLKEVLIFFGSKLIFLLSAREAVGMSGDWLTNTDKNIIFTSSPFITNIISAFFLFIINFLGLISIFKLFSKNFKQAFLFSLIPLIPLISFASHHRYFLPYSIITSACLPFLLAIQKNRNQI